LLQALVAQTMGELSPALTFLEHALRLAESKGIIQTFVDEGPALARLLYELVKREIEKKYAQRLIAAFPAETPEPTGVLKSETDEWVEPLTERELEVLQFIAEGLTNREVGERLYLTANTVKAHARTIYSKLGVNNRTQAVAKGRSLGIISDQ
jgi:LuxR family maltose regulon positive regulatory protein